MDVEIDDFVFWTGYSDTKHSTTLKSTSKESSPISIFKGLFDYTVQKYTCITLHDM